MKKYLSLLLIFAMLILPTATFAEGDDMSQTIDISSHFNYDFVIDKKDGYYTGKPLAYMVNKDNITSISKIGDISYSLTANDFGENDSVYVSSDDVTVENIPAPSPIGSYNPKAKAIGFVAGTLGSASDVTVSVTYKDGTNKTEKTISVLPVTEQGTLNASAGKSLVKSSGISNKFKVAEGADVYMNAYTFEIDPNQIDKITFKANSTNPYHVSAVSVLYYTESEWASNIGKGVNNIYPKYKDANPNTVITDYSDIATLVSYLNAIVPDVLAGNEVGLSEEVKNTLNERGIVSEIERLEMLNDCLNLKKEKQALKEEIDALNPSKYVDAEADAYKSYTNDDLTALNGLIEKYTAVETLNTKLDPIAKYWETKGVNVDLAEINVSDKAKFVDLKTKYVAYQNKTAFDVDLESVYTASGTKTVETLTDSEFNAIKAFFENENYFNSNFQSDFVTADNEAKVNTLKYLYDNYEAYKKSESAYMVDLTSYFNRDIFANVGETVDSSWGFKEKVSPDTKNANLTLYNQTGLDLSTVEPSLKNGILFSDSKAKIYSANTLATQDEIDSYVSSTPFDLSKITKQQNNAVVFDENVYVEGSRQIITFNYDEKGSVFSGMPSKYLLVLSVVGRGSFSSAYTVKYTDGTTSAHSIAYNWAGAHVSNCALNMGQTARVYVGNGASDNTVLKTAVGSWSSSHPDIHTSVLMVSAIPTNGKTIESVENNCVVGYGPSVVLAMSEIPVKNAEFLGDIVTPAWNEVKDFTETDYTASNLDKMKNIVNCYNGVIARGLNPNDVFGESGVSKILEMKTLILTLTSGTKRVSKNQIKSTIKFSVPATDVARNITVTKGDEAVDFDVKVANDNLSAEITIDVTQNGGDKYNFKVLNTLPVKSNTSMTLGADYEYSYTVPDYVTYDYANKTLVNNSDDNADFTATSVVVGNDGKTVYGADSEKAVNTGSGVVNNLGISVSERENSSVYNYVFDNNFKLVSNNTNIGKITAETNEDANYNAPQFNIDTNTLTLEGFTPSKEENKIVNIKIFDDKNNKDVYFGSVKTNKDGYFKYEIVLPESVYTSAFNMKLTLGGDDFNAPVVLANEVYYATKTERTDLIEYLANATDVTDITNGTFNGEKLTVSKVVKTLALDFEPVQAVSDEAFAKAIISVLSEYNADDLKNDLELTQKVLKQSAIMAAFKESKIDSIFKNGKLLFADIMEYSKIDTNGVTLYDVFNNNVSLNGKEKIVKDLLNKDFNGVSDLYNELGKKIFVEALNYPVSLGTGYVSAVLTDKNATAVGTDVTKYTTTTSKDAFAQKIADNRGNFTDVASVKAFVDSVNIVQTPQTPAGSIGGTGGGSGSSSGSFSVSGNVTPSTPQGGTTVAPSEIFADVNKAHWAYDNIVSLYKKGIVSGKENKEFDPDGYVTRGEVAKMVCVAYKLERKGENPFEDVSGKWYEDYVVACYENKLVSGITDTYFGGDEKITRQDLCTILYRLKNDTVNADLSFADSSEIADYAKAAVSYMNSCGIVNGFTDNTFKPNDFCTRAQMAKIFDLFIQR